MPTDLTDQNVFTEPVSVPEEGDDRNAASVEIPFQALANRTRNLKHQLEAGIATLTQQLGALDAADHNFSGAITFESDVLFEGGVGIYSDSEEVTYITKRTRKRLIPLHNYYTTMQDRRSILISGGASTGSPGSILASTAGEKVLLPIELASGNLLQSLRAAVHKGPTAGNIVMELYRSTPDLVGGTSSTPLLLGSASHSVTGTGAIRTINVAGFDYVNRAAELLVVEFALPTVGDSILWVEIEYSDPGPRTH